jgi:hypothetical protein
MEDTAMAENETTSPEGENTEAAPEEQMSESETLRAALAEARAETGRLRNAHKERQKEFDKLKKERDDLATVAQEQLAELRTGVDPSILEPLEGLSVRRQMSILRAVHGRSPKAAGGETVSPPEDRQPTPQVPRPSISPLASRYESELKALQDSGQATIQAVIDLAAKYRGQR